MRVYPLLLVAAATLSAYADADASSTRSSPPSDRLTPSHQLEPQQYLRDGAVAPEEEMTTEFLKILDELSIAGPPSDTYMTSFIHKYGDSPAHETFASFQLGKTGDNLLQDPQFIWWARIMQHQNRDQPAVAIAKLLAAHYGDDGLLKMLKKPTDDPATKKLAASLEDGWIKSKVKPGVPTDEEINHVLKLINFDGNVLSTPPFKAWVGLMEQKHQNSDEVMATELAAYYGDDRLLEILEKATQDSATVKRATGLQDGWIQSKVKAGVQIDEETKVLKLINIDDENYLSTPAYKAWVRLMEQKFKKTHKLYRAMTKQLAFISMDMMF